LNITIGTASITITSQPEPPPPPALPDGARTVTRTWRYVERCLCGDCLAHRAGQLYWRNDNSLVPADTLTRDAPHEYPKAPPEPNTDAWRERSARGSKLLRGLLTGEQLRVWDRFRALIIRYEEFENEHCSCDDCNEGPIAGLLLTPEDERELGRWEFNEKGTLIHRRNVWALDGSLWSYEDELISLLLYYQSDPGDFLCVGCRDRASYFETTPAYKRADRIMRRVGRFPETTEGKFALADEPGMFAGTF
jgi:hypothetical protein